MYGFGRNVSALRWAGCVTARVVHVCSFLSAGTYVTLNPQPSALNPQTLKPSTLKPSNPQTLKPLTLRLQPATLCPHSSNPQTLKPSTLNPQPTTLILQPLTLNTQTLNP